MSNALDFVEWKQKLYDMFGIEPEELDEFFPGSPGCEEQIESIYGDRSCGYYVLNKGLFLRGFIV
jgi:hypothetical protein